MTQRETESALAALKAGVCAICPFSEDDWKPFEALWKPCTARRKEALTTPGQTERYLYFVIKGVQRIYYFDEQNREATLVFTYAPSFGGVLDALMLGTPSRYYYETLTSSVFLRASFADILRLNVESPAVQRLLRQGLAQALAGVLERLAEVQCYTSEERFRKLLQRSPHILQRVPHKYLANYLGIDATHFSKLLNKVKI